MTSESLQPREAFGFEVVHSNPRLCRKEEHAYDVIPEGGGTPIWHGQDFKCRCGEYGLRPVTKDEKPGVWAQMKSWFTNGGSA